MRGMTIILALGLILAAGPSRGADGWLTDRDAALKAAQAQNRPVLAAFTGSDWCPPCQALKAEVFDTEGFKQWAAANVVLLEIDGPRNDKAVAERNKPLFVKYGIDKVPTILVLTAGDEVMGGVGYLPGGPAVWLPIVQSIIDDLRITLAPSLEDGAVDAKDGKRPLLMIAVTAPEGAAAADALQAEPGLIALSRGAVTVTRFLAAEGHSRELFTKLNITPGPAHALLYDVAADKVLVSQAITAGGTAALVQAIRAQLPPVTYDGAWLEDFDEARRVAAVLERPVLIDFTGSDWCEWCRKLEAEVFDTPAFKAYAKGALVLMKADFPQALPQTDALKAQNQALGRRYQPLIPGFPTVLLVDAGTGAVHGQLGYMEGGPEPFLKALKALLK